jgi:hypothetical protein
VGVGVGVGVGVSPMSGKFCMAWVQNGCQKIFFLCSLVKLNGRPHLEYDDALLYYSSVVYST